MSDSINLPDRKNLRLEGFDYSKSGLYFITICTNNRECLFGRIENGQMILNDQLINNDHVSATQNPYHMAKTTVFLAQPLAVR